MRRIILKEARPGMQVARTIELPTLAAGQSSSQDNTPAVPSGAVLTVDHLIRLHELGVYDLWIDDPQLDFLDDLDSVVLSTPQHRLLDALRTSFQKLIALGANGGDPQKPLLKRYRMALIEMVHSLLRAVPAVTCFAPMALQHEELMRHSADVCVLAALLGLQLEHYLVEQRRRLTCKQARDVLNLAMDVMYHVEDEMFMPAAQRESRVELTIPQTANIDAGEEWKQHTSQGYAAVRTVIDPSAAAIVLHHHQHFDGSGFALAEARLLVQTAASIHVFSRIAMAADVFHHVLQPAGAVQQPTVRALSRIRSASLCAWFDPVVCKMLCAMIPAFVPGMVVTLSNRRQALVRRVHEKVGEQPGWVEVQILREPASMDAAAEQATTTLDADEARKLRIVEIDGSDITNCAEVSQPVIVTGQVLAAARSDLAAAP